MDDYNVRDEVSDWFIRSKRMKRYKKLGIKLKPIEREFLEEKIEEYLRNGGVIHKIHASDDPITFDDHFNEEVACTYIELRSRLNELIYK